ncbi:MAG: hypothetical protein II998_08005 [Clostridia bacterium]|nr:hypothetical protein [Clostridia bacterium]
MDGKYYALRFGAIIFTLAAIVFIFFEWFMIDSGFSKADSISVTGLHELFTETDDITNSSLIDAVVELTMDRTVAIVILFSCGFVEYALILSVGLALCGIVKSLILNKRTKMLAVSQIINLVIQGLIYIVVIAFNFFDITVMSIRVNDLLTIFPTYWMGIATFTSAMALVLSKLYQKKYLR